MKKTRYAASFFIVLCGIFMGITAFQYKAKGSQSGKEAIPLDTQVDTEIREQIADENEKETEIELELSEETEKKSDEMESAALEQEQSTEEAEQEQSTDEVGQEQSAAETGEETSSQDREVQPEQVPDITEVEVQEEPGVPEEEEQPEAAQIQPEPTDWVQSLRNAEQASQLLVVSATGTQAEVTLHNRDQNGNWYEAIRTNGFVGRDGGGQTSEYNQNTPAGIYQFSMAFGILPDPGSQIAYTQVDESDYWVDDPESQYYNQFVSTNAVQQDWNSAEHLISTAPAYDYALALNYNAACVPGNGSAIFLHVSTGRSTAGCISVPEDVMISFLQNITPGCTILIADSGDLNNY